MKRFLTLVTIVLLLGLAPNAMAQETAMVTGTVTDATGALIPGAEVTANNINTGISTLRVSGESGSYAIPGLLPGAYSIFASLPGFSDATIEVNLSQNQTFRFNFELQVGTVATAIEVVSDADALLATTGASVGDALPEEEVLALPLATRDVFDLLSTTAGLVRRGRTDRDETDDGSNFAGQRVSSVNTTRDGIPVSDGRYLDWNGAFAATYSSPDLVEEIQISVGTVDAASGRGSSQVRLQTRSGTNEFHGALFYTTNNSALNANSFFQNLRGEKKDWTNRNQFGGRIGGPIIRNKAFFFVLLDEQRYKTRNSVTGNVWTQQALAGNFRYFPGVENDNALGGAGASVNLAGNPTAPAAATGALKSFHLFTDVQDPNRGPSVSTNAFIQETLRRMPVANNFTVGDGLNTAGFDWVQSTSGQDNAAGTSQNTNRDNLNIRLDYQINDSNKINFITSREHNYVENSQPTWPGGYGGQSTRDPNITTLSWTATVSPVVLNEFRFGFRKTNWSGRPPFSIGCCEGSNESPTAGLTEKGLEAFAFFQFSNNYPYMPPMSSISGRLWMTTPSGTTTRDQTSPLWTYQDTVSWVQGAHSFTAGWEGVWADSNGWNSGGLWPRVALGSGDFEATNINDTKFPGLQDSDINLAQNILNDMAGSVGNLRQTFLVNDPAVGFIDIQTSVKQQLNFHQDDWAAYFKDDWNISQNLTLNYGVRWDMYGVPYEGKGLNAVPVGNIVIPDIAAGKLVSVINVGKHSLNPNLSMYSKDMNNVAPSLGFSYRVPWLDRTTVVRGGYGISYSGAPTFLQFDFGIGRQAGKSDPVSVEPNVYTAVPGSTNPNAALAQFPLTQTISEPFGVVPLTNRRSSVYTYADDRRIPYIQNMNLSIETQLAPDTNLSVTYLGTKGTSLWSGRQLNEPNIFASKSGITENFLNAFITTRGGGDSALFADMFKGLNFGTGVIGTAVTASSALRDWRNTDDYFADGEVAAFAEFVNNSSSRAGHASTGTAGGLLRANGYPENFLVASPQFNQVDFYDNGDNSTYHSLQVQVTKRVSSGFSGQFSYTWSKAIGNGGTSLSPQREDQSFATRDNLNRALQKGLVTFSRAHALNAHGVWSLPFGPGRLLGSGVPSVVSRLIEGWQLSSIMSWDSGEPFSLSSSMETLVAEDDINTPDLVGGISAFGKGLGQVDVNASGHVNYLTGFTRVAEPTLDYYGTNPDSLQSHDAIYQIVDASGSVILRNPKPGTTGNLATNWLTGPGRLGVDFALQKSVQLNEGMEFTVRMDAIDILNTPRWGQPNGNINSSSFGRITRAAGNRTFTLNARIDF